MKNKKTNACLIGIMLVSIVVLSTPTLYANPDGLVATAGGPYVASECQSILFTGTGGDYRGQLQYRWDFNNDGIWDMNWTNCTFDNMIGIWDAYAPYTYYDEYHGFAILQVTDGANISTDSAVVDVSNVAPVVLSMTASLDAEVGSEEPVTVSFFDGYNGTSSTDSFTVIFTWGDGALSSMSLPSGTQTVVGTHIYSQAGGYTVTVTVTDDDGGTTTGTLPGPVTVTVPNPTPGTGFVTGGGWIVTAAGSYRPDPTITGTANFGFNSMYKKGHQTPDGQTEFNFQEAGLNFHSGSYDWLSVVGSVATYQGTGTINGAGSYGFILKAVDGKTQDAFRIRIWDKSTGVLVFDNNADTVLSGGQIQVHRA